MPSRAVCQKRSLDRRGCPVGGPIRPSERRADRPAISRRRLLAGIPDQVLLGVTTERSEDDLIDDSLLRNFRPQVASDPPAGPGRARPQIPGLAEGLKTGGLAGAGDDLKLSRRGAGVIAHVADHDIRT